MVLSKEQNIVKDKELSDRLMDLRYEAKVSALARLLEILTHTYFIQRNMDELKKIEGSEIGASFPKLGGKIATVKIINGELHPQMGAPSNPKTTLIFNLEYDEIVPVINDVLKTKSNIFGIIKLFFKYIFALKIRYKPKSSLWSAIKMVKCIMIGFHPMYEGEKELLKKKGGDN